MKDIEKYQIIKPKDLAAWQNLSLKSAQRKVRTIKKHYKKEQHHVLNLEEVANYYDFPIEILVQICQTINKQ
ncbi:hypothetical protein [Haloflavibacter putidus]|uniref:Uncharacterized protein n=1 Tax=Haloflavibacter putidus TaxID=2576776 RepID=A0A507ZFY3_9FLAO|nr:hypothetical protein [Haloflavibacter putidus]TQD33805.1 hypothetical protein FKR84_12665 [Haloflavibacter putidus]